MKNFCLVVLVSLFSLATARADFPGRGGFGGGEDFRRPPQFGQDLCQGTYIGTFSNGFNANFNMNPGWGDELTVYVTIPGANYIGRGTCRQWGYQAQVEFVTTPTNYEVTANIDVGPDGRAYMTGFVTLVNLGLNLVRQ